ncbi:MAG: hypothetical protein HY741_13050 [Chloroflexi bacterium]|nr:hypothetical protein [Chloroflexota bacterium]
MTNLRIAVNMQPARDDTGALKFKATLPMGVLFEKSLDKQQVERERVALGEAYAELVAQLRTHRAAMNTHNVMAYWQFGDALLAFENHYKTSLLFVDRLIDHLTRDVDFSITMILLCRRFREAFPDPNRVDPKQSFTNYQRAGFDPARLSPIVRRRGRPHK